MLSFPFRAIQSIVTLVFLWNVDLLSSSLEDLGGTSKGDTKGVGRFENLMGFGIGVVLDLLLGVLEFVPLVN